jgi:dienelactone hydrolase
MRLPAFAHTLMVAIAGPRWMALETGAEADVTGHAVFLSGNSYPADNHAHDAMYQRLARDFAYWTSQDQLLLLDRKRRLRHMDRRLSQLRRLIRNDRVASDVVLFGRSSGARLATLFPRHCKVRAVVCFSYPFHPPGADMDPARFAHLKDIETPVLIIQGEHDAYGGADIQRTYDFSPKVEIAIIDGDHDLRLGETQWDDVAGLVRRFLARV